MEVNSIRDNRDCGRVGDFLCKNIEEGALLSFVSAYFTIYAYDALCKGLNELDKKSGVEVTPERAGLNRIEKLRFLFGEPNFVTMQNGLEKKTFSITDESGASDVVVSNEVRLGQKAIAKKCAEWIKEKVDIRSLTQENFLHGKLYHILNKNTVTSALCGSSNFTTRGLGLAQKNNMELNLIVKNDDTRKELLEWFDKLWTNNKLTQDVKSEVLENLKKLYDDAAPQLVYYKTLYELFSEYVKNQKDDKLLQGETKFTKSAVWNILYDFQKDAVRAAIEKLNNFGGCIIADSVGLGKTFEALAVMKYFQSKNYNILVLCPKKLSQNWTFYEAHQNNALNPLKADRLSYTVLYHTDLNRTEGKSGTGVEFENFSWDTFDLVVIDESHNFKGNPAEKEKKNGEIKLNRAAFLLKKIIGEGAKPKVLMLSATPVNNSLKDLRNQINYITGGEDYALKESAQIGNISGILRIAQKQFSQWAKNRTAGASQKTLLEKLDAPFFKLMDALTIARSRKHIRTFYKESAVGDFPQRLAPESVCSVIDKGTGAKGETLFPSFDDVDKKIHTYKLSLYNPSAFLKDGKTTELYEKKAGRTVAKTTQDKREFFLIGMMKTGFMKRLESSVNSFALSMSNTIDRIDKCLELIKAYKAGNEALGDEEVDPKIESIEDLSELDEFNEGSAFFDNDTVGKKLKLRLKDLRVDEWEKALISDREPIKELEALAKVVKPARDAKLETLQKIIANKCASPINGKNKKVLIFTAFGDTAMYLYNNIAPWAKKSLGVESALVTGQKALSTTGVTHFVDVLTCFSPLSKGKGDSAALKSKAELDILIATDCISEGQNLQDCDCVINYDIHWNPVRIIQRFGRIDRIGSCNKKIKMINFWPTEDLNKYLNLKTRVESRMALVDLSATGDDNLLENGIEEVDLEKEDIDYRDKQLEELKKVVIDLEDTSSVSLTDFNLADFRAELLNFLKANAKALESTPYGIYAVVPSPKNDERKEVTYSDSQKAVITSGVIFCLKQKSQNKEIAKVNPLAPFFLSYVKSDGSVQYSFMSAKQVLDVYRLLCSGVGSPYEALCREFDKKTSDGRDMSALVALLQKAAKNIENNIRKANDNQATTTRDGGLLGDDELMSNINDFELVTYLVIK